MTAPERLWVDWTPVDEIDLPTAMSAYTPKARQAPHFQRIEYIRADIAVADLARVTAELKVTDYLLLAETQLSLDRLARAEAAEAKVARLVNEPIEAVLAKITMWREYDDTRDWVAPGKTLLAELRAVISDIREAPDA